MVAAGPAAAAPRVVWLCKPGLEKNPCNPGLAPPILAVGQAPGRKPPAPGQAPQGGLLLRLPDRQRPADGLANRRVDPEERSIALYQAARYSQYCRVFAPMYRQRTLRGPVHRNRHGSRARRGVRGRPAGLAHVPAPLQPRPRHRPDRSFPGDLRSAKAHRPRDRPQAVRCAGDSRRPCSSAATWRSGAVAPWAATSSTSRPAARVASCIASSPSRRLVRRPRRCDLRAHGHARPRGPLHQPHGSPRRLGPRRHHRPERALRPRRPRRRHLSGCTSRCPRRQPPGSTRTGATGPAAPPREGSTCCGSRRAPAPRRSRHRPTRSGAAPGATRTSRGDPAGLVRAAGGRLRQATLTARRTTRQPLPARA